MQHGLQKLSVDRSIFSSETETTMTVLSTANQLKDQSSRSLDELYSRNPGAAQVGQTQQAQSQNATASQGTASNYEAQTREMGETELADNQLNRITSQDSPLMQRAKQEGMLTAAKRGLQNSSIAAGTSMGAMVDRAAPLAQQNAQQAFQQGRANQDSTNTARAQNAQLETEISNQNAQMSTDVSKANAALGTDTSKFNAGLAMDRELANAAAENTLRQTVLTQNAELNKQFLAGTQAMDLATIQGQYQQLISTNEMAANLYNAYFTSIGQVMANKDMPPDRVAEMVRLQQSTLEAGLRMMDLMNTMDLDAALPPAGGSGSSGGATGSPVGGAAGATPAPMQLVGDTYLPEGTITRQIEGRRGYYDVFDAQGNRIGLLRPGGKNGRFIRDG
jgi:hypothetical protein